MSVPRLKLGTILFVIVGLAFAFIAMPNSSPDVSLAQGEETIAYGESKQGEVPAGGTARYGFDAAAGDVAQVDVLAFGFAPTVRVIDGANAIVGEELNPNADSAVELSVNLPANGRYIIEVGSADGGSGGIGISLSRGERVLPPGETLFINQPLVVDIASSDVPGVVDFSIDPNGSVVLNVRSLTPEYRPTLSILGQEGDEILMVSNSRLSGYSFTFEPGTETLKLVLDLGDSPSAAAVEVSLVPGSSDGTGPVATEQSSDGGNTGGNTGSSSDTGVGLDNAPQSGCYVTANQNINLRSGGSTSHPVVNVMGAGKYLQVTGQNPANGTWYEVAIPGGGSAWIAGAVTTTGGDCSNVPTKQYPAAPSGGNDGGNTGGEPTATSPSETQEATTTAPTATTAAQTAAPDSDYNVDLNQNGDTANLSGDISYPNGDTTDRVTYNLSGYDSVDTSSSVVINWTCSGTGVEFVRINNNNMGSVGPSTCPANSSKFHTNDNDVGRMRIDLTGGDNAYVTWSLTLIAQDD